MWGFLGGRGERKNQVSTDLSSVVTNICLCPSREYSSCAFSGRTETHSDTSEDSEKQS